MATSETLELPQPVYVFTMSGRSNEYQGPNYNGHSHKVELQGSNDGNNWVSLLSSSKSTSSSTANGETYSQTKMNETAYKYFRFRYTSDWSDAKYTYGSFRYFYIS